MSPPSQFTVVPDALWEFGTTPFQHLQEVPVPDAETPLTCSSKGCQVLADWALQWNNPKLHTPDRRKVWLACEQHRSTLGDFLTARQFLREVVPAAEGEAR